MTIHITDPETIALIRRLAASTGKEPTEAIRDAVAEKIERNGDQDSFRARLKAIQDRFAALPDTGLKADKAFFDDLSGDH